jgi:predicted P-loop ATPase
MGEIIPLNAWKGSLQRDDKQGVRKNLTNLMLHLRNLPTMGDQFRFNDLTGNIEWQNEEIQDTSYIDIRLQIESAGFAPAERDIPMGVQRLAQDNRYNPVEEYLKGLRWDGKPRVDHWLQQIFQADDTQIIRAFGRMFLISAVARALQPGSKVDTMLILEGKQGIKKSSAVSALFGDDFVLNGLPAFKGNEAGLSLQGRWAVDLGELGGMNKTDVRTVKNFLSLTMDTYRPIWGRHYINRPRRVVFIGSTNEQDYLRDSTGARRFWPIACRSVDLDLLRKRRDQLWAEAVRLFSDGEPWWIDTGSGLDQEAEKVQAERYVEDVWAPNIDTFINSLETRMRGCVTASEILQAMNVQIERRDASAEARVTAHLTHLGWTKARARRHGNNLNWWFPPGKAPKKGDPDE